MNERILQSDEVLRLFVETALPVIKRDLAPSKILLFGSRVRGEAREESDIDVIIVSDYFRGVKFVRRMALVLKKVSFPRHVDYICYTPEEFEQVKESSTIVEAALSEGIYA